ncbi:MAG: YdiU family protein [Nevskiaceae bacterium]|nr:MAG: YdiU family protein [Nevskiaceae bacterium]
MHRLDDLAFDNRFAQLPPDYYSRVQPTPLPQPHLLHFNTDAAALIDLDPAEATQPAFAEIFAGNRLPTGADPIATLYAGHQFGSWVPQLGDGRAILLGQVRNARGERWELQLKGAGPTPYSRFADGRAVLRSTVREYLCGEAMHGLGIPTTRALCIVTSPEPVRRETLETAAVLTRMAPSHVRFGHFEVFYYREQYDKLGPLADHVIAGHFPQHAGNYAAWLTEVTERTARLMAQWQTVGFCHGVMNTDNMSILGLTLDYGPFGFLDAFDAHHICNHSDEGGRYAYDRQPEIGYWNVSRLLQATLPLLHETSERAVEIAQGILERFGPAFASEVTARWRAKLGLREARDDDATLINRFLSILHRGKSDFTRSFRHLSRVRTDTDAPADGVREEIADIAAFDAWIADYRTRLRGEHSDDEVRAARMNAVNPKYVLRNHLAQRAIEVAQRGNASEIDTLLTLLRRPFDEHPEFERYAAEPPPEARHLEVSCSS